MHNLWLLSLQGELGLSPKAKNGAKRVLDAGTGTGIWAVEYGMELEPFKYTILMLTTNLPSPADAHPEAEVRVYATGI